MSAHAQPTFLFASPDTDLLTAIEPTLLAAGARVDIVLSASGRAGFHLRLAPSQSGVARRAIAGHAHGASAGRGPRRS